VAPGAYWTKYLWIKLDKLAKKKLPSNRTFYVDDTDIVICVNYRGEADLTTRSDGLDINWRMIESKLQAWSHLLLARIMKSFHPIMCGIIYVDK
jgi:hypothetical protein